jgi:hypothetical protein
MTFDPNKEILDQMSVPPEFDQIKHFFLATLAPRNVRHSTSGMDMIPQGIAVIPFVRENDRPPDVADQPGRGFGVMLISRPEHQRKGFSPPVDARAELRVPPALGFPKCPGNSVLRMPARILMDLDVGGVDDFEGPASMPAGMQDEQVGENALPGPAQVEAVDAVPLAIPGGKLIPHASGDQNPPDAIQSFSKIGRLAAFFTNVRFALPLLKLIFLGARKARPASGMRMISCRGDSALIALDFKHFHFVHTA